MHIFDAATTHTLLPYAALADEIRAVLRDKVAGTATAPQRVGVPLPNAGILLVMPAADNHIAITKLVTVHPHNATLGLPTVNAEVVVMNSETGERLMMLDGKAVTARRTAAVSLLAAQMLASDRAKAGPILIIGAGTQGRAHVEAFGEWLPTLDIFIYSRTHAKAQALAQHGRDLGFKTQAIEDVNAIMPVSGLIITGTTSTAPIFEDRVCDGAMAIAVGAYSHSMCELPHALVRRSRVVVDTLEGAKHEAGDISQAGVDWAMVEALESVIQESDSLKKSVSLTTVFKSVGHALWDLAAARLAAREPSP